MGFYVGPPPGEYTDEEMADYMAKLKPPPKTPKPDVWPVPTGSTRKVDEMSQQNTNKMTPRPNVHPPSQRLPRAAMMTVERDGILIYGTYEQLKARGYLDPPTDSGATERLPTHCRHCGDELPYAAQFCIACGKAV